MLWCLSQKQQSVFADAGSYCSFTNFLFAGADKMSALTESFRLADMQSSAFFPCGNVDTRAAEAIKNGTCGKNAALEAAAASETTLEGMLSNSLDGLQSVQKSVAAALESIITFPIVEVTDKLVRAMKRPAEASRSASAEEQ